MDWLEIVSWIAGSVLLAGLHVWRRKPVKSPMGVFASSIIGALVGGMFAHVLLVKPFTVGYSFAALVAALVVAELGILMALATRTGQRPPLAPGGGA